jgi:hypothetical protein
MMIPVVLLILTSCVAPQITPTSQPDVSAKVIKTVQPTVEVAIQPTVQATIQPTVSVRDAKLTLQPQLPASNIAFTRPSTIYHKVVAVSPQFIFFLPIESKGPLILFDMTAKLVITTTFNNVRGNPTFPYDLIMGHDGQVWSLGIVDGAFDVWVLRRFDPQRMTFIPVQDEKGVLRGDSVQGTQSLCEDTKATLWLIIDDHLIKYSPRTGLAERVSLSEADYHVAGFKPSIDAIQCDERGNVWLVITQYAQSLEQTNFWKLYRLDGANHHLINYKSPIRALTNNFVGQFLFDPSGNVWVVNLDPVPATLNLEDATPQWQVIQPAVESFEPVTLFRSSDGRFWMSSYTGQGIVAYNPMSSSWQSISHIRSAVGQSQDGALWTADEKQIYKIVQGDQ